MGLITIPRSSWSSFRDLYAVVNGDELALLFRGDLTSTRVPAIKATVDTRKPPAGVHTHPSHLRKCRLVTVRFPRAA